MQVSIIKEPHYNKTPEIWSVIIKYENDIYEHDKLYNYYISVFNKYINYDDINIKNIIKYELRQLRIIVNDHYTYTTHTKNKDDMYYGHWYILNWIYGRWNIDKINKNDVKWIQDQLEIINSNNKVCEEIIDRLIYYQKK